MPENPYGNVRDLFETAPSFFTVRALGIRQGCHGYSHGIVYEGRWVLHKGIPMKGQSKLDLKDGTEFELLYRNDVFVPWFKKVLNGDYMGHDFDTLSFKVLESLTSPNAPGSFASAKPAGFNPSASLTMKDDHIVANTKRHKSTDLSIGQESTISGARDNSKRPKLPKLIVKQPTNKSTNSDVLQSQKDAIISVEEEVAPALEAPQRTYRIATEAPAAAMPPTGIPQNQTVNLGHRPLLSENDLQGYIRVSTKLQLLFTWDESIRQGSVQFYDRSVMDIVFTWAQNRQSLMQDIMQPDASRPVARATLARAISNDNNPASANLGHQGEGDLDNHMHMCIMMQSLFAWDESIRQRSPTVRKGIYIINEWSQQCKLLLQVISGESSA